MGIYERGPHKLLQSGVSKGPFSANQAGVESEEKLQDRAPGACPSLWKCSSGMRTMQLGAMVEVSGETECVFSQTCGSMHGFSNAAVI